MKKVCLLFAALLVTQLAKADVVTVAVAANFTDAATKLSQDFEASSQHKVELVFGSTGSLYAQIVNGAPYDLFLAADKQRPLQLLEAGFASSQRHFTYAIGELVLVSARPLDNSPEQALAQAERFEHLVIANPQTAPYGKQALVTLDTLGLKASWQDKLIEAGNVAQAFQYLDRALVDFAFLARAQVISKDLAPSQIWVVPQQLYQPIKQEAALLKQAESKPAALSFYDYLQSEQAQSRIAEFGYKSSLRPDGV